MQVLRDNKSKIWKTTKYNLNEITLSIRLADRSSKFIGASYCPTRSLRCLNVAVGRFWTWIGTAYIPAAASGIFYINNGPHRGVLISAGYLGLCASLAVGTILAGTLALYVMKARKSADPILAPPNTLFEDTAHRNRLISWGTVIVFALAVLLGLAGFGNRYADSRIHLWGSTTPLADSFGASRTVAYAKGCPKGPCYAMGQRMEEQHAIQAPRCIERSV